MSKLKTLSIKELISKPNQSLPNTNTPNRLECNKWHNKALQCAIQGSSCNDFQMKVKYSNQTINSQLLIWFVKSYLKPKFVCKNRKGPVGFWLWCRAIRSQNYILSWNENIFWLSWGQFWKQYCQLQCRWVRNASAATLSTCWWSWDWPRPSWVWQDWASNWVEWISNWKGC